VILAKHRFLALVSTVAVVGLYNAWPLAVSGSSGPGVGNVPQGTQSDTTYARSFMSNHVSNVDATTQATSCYTPEVPYATSDGPNDGYSGESACGGASTTGENSGPYATQSTSGPGSPATTPMLVKDHSESDIRVDPTNPRHLIGSSKWFVSPEGYNHLLGFYESFDGGKSWSVQGHIPGYEGWTDNTDPIGAFDANGNYYEFILGYQFYYNADGSHNFNTGSLEPNPGVPAEVVAVAVHPAGSTSPNQWIVTHNGGPDYVATYDSIGNEPDKQWITIDTNKNSPHFNRVYAMWVNFHFTTPVPYIAYADAKADGSHSNWSAPIPLPMGSFHPTGDTYLLPHVTPDGNVYTTLTNEQPPSFTINNVVLDRSTDGGNSWSTISKVITGATGPSFCCFKNTTFRDGIFNTFTTSSFFDTATGHYPLYVAWEDYSTGWSNVILTASFDGGFTWSAPIQVNDNSSSKVDEFQPNLAAAPDGTVSVAFYDRRLACPASGTTGAINAGIALDKVNPNYSGALPPYGASNYCVNTSIQFYQPDLTPIGHNVRISANTWDPQLNAAHYGSASSKGTFIGDYFGNTIAGSTDYTTSASTYNDGTNPDYRQQQIVAAISVP